MKIRKILMLILIMLCAGTGVLSGCGDTFANLSAQIDKEEITIYFEEKDNQKTSDTFTVTLEGLSEEASAEVYCNAENPTVAVFSVQTDEETDTSTVSVSPNLGGSTKVSLIHRDSNKVVGQVAVNVIRPVEVITQSKAQPFVYVSADGSLATILDASQHLIFTPENTTQKDIVYSITPANAKNGVSVTETGKLVARQYPSGGYVDVTATVKGTNISTVIRVKALMPIEVENIKISKIVETEHIEIDHEEGINLITNRASDSEMYLNTDVTYAGTDPLTISYEVGNSEIIGCSQLNNTECIVVAGNQAAKTYIKVKVAVKGYENCFEEVVIPVNVIEVPSVLTINGSNESVQEYDVYDSYNKLLGQEFKVEVGLSSANSLEYALQISSEDLANIEIFYENGEVVETNLDVDGQLKIAGASKFYVKAKDTAQFNKTIELNVYAVGGIGYSNPTKTTLRLTPRHGVSSIIFNQKETFFSEGHYYLACDKTISLTFGILNKELKQENIYSDKFTIVTSNASAVAVQEVIIGKQDVFTYSLDVTGLADDLVELTVIASNGISATILIRVFTELNFFTLSSDSYIDNANIGDIQYQVVPNFNNEQTLSYLAVREGSLTNIYVNKFNTENVLAPSATVAKTNFTVEEGSESIAISGTGELYANLVTNWEEGQTNYVTAKVNCVIDYYTNTGIVSSDILTFNVVVYKTVNNISIKQNGVNIDNIDIYSYGSDLYYYNDYLTKTISYNINPNSATHYEILEWGESSSERKILETSTNGNECTIKTASPIVNEQTTTKIILKVKQFNKIYTKQLSVRVIRLDAIISVDNLTYKIGNQDEQALTDYIDNENTVTNSEMCLGELYVDYRDVNQSTEIKLNMSFSPITATFKDYILHYENHNKQERDSIKVNDNNTISALLGGTGRLYIIPKTMFVESTQITTEMLNACNYVYIKVADGRSLSTAFELKTVDDILRMNTSDSLNIYRYYELACNIDVSRVTSWNPIGSNNSQFGFRGYLTSKDNLGTDKIEVYTISGIRLDANISSGAYGFFGNCSDITLSNVNFEIESINLNLESINNITDIYVGGVIGNLQKGAISNINVNIKESNIVSGYAINLVFGAIVGQNNASVTNCKATGKINVTREATKESNNEDLKLFIGGLVGENNGIVMGKYAHKQSADETKTYYLDSLFSGDILDSTVTIVFQNNYLNSYLNAVGGAVGYNLGIVSNIAVSPTIYASDNVGGICGQSKGQIKECAIMLLNSKDSNNDYISAIYGDTNVGGVAGYVESNADYIEVDSVIALSLDVTNYKQLTNSTIYPMIYGKYNVGGLVGYAENSTIKQSYISSYFVRTLGLDHNNNVTYLGTIGIENDAVTGLGGLIGEASSVTIEESFANIEINSHLTNILAGGLVGKSTDVKATNSYVILDKIDNNVINVYSNSIILENCYAFVNDTEYYLNEHASTNADIQALVKVIGSKYITSTLKVNKQMPALIALVYVDQPTSIIVTIKDTNEYIVKVNETKAILYFYTNNENKNIIQISDIITFINEPNTIEGYINVHSSNEKIVTYNSAKGELTILKTGKVNLTFTSLLNNTLSYEIQIVVLDDINSYAVYKDLYHNNVITNAVDDSKHINVLVNGTYDIFPYLDTDTTSGVEDYFALNNNEYKYTAEDLLLEFVISSNGNDSVDLEKLFTINNKQWVDGKITISALQRMSIIAGSFSGSAKLTVNLLANNNGENAILKTISFIVNINNGIKDIKLSASSAEISLKDILELDAYIYTDYSREQIDSLDEINELITTSVYINKTEMDTTGAHRTNGIECIASYDISDENLLNEGIIKYSLTFKVTNEEEVFGGETDKLFNIEINSQINNSKDLDNQEKTANFELKVKEQNIENIKLNYYANSEKITSVDSTTGDKETSYTINEVPTNNIIAGTMGILKVNLYPSSAKIKQVTVEYDTNSEYSMLMQQMLLYSGTNLKEYIGIAPNAVPTKNGKGIVLTGTYAYASKDASGVIDKVENAYDGNLFIGLSIGGGVPEGIDYNITVSAITINDEIYSETITLRSTLKTGITMGYNDSEKDYIPVGMQKTFTVHATKMIETPSEINKIWFTVNNSSKIKNNGNEYSYNNGEVVIKFVSSQQVATRSYDITYSIEFSTDSVSNKYEIYAYLTKSVNNALVNYKADEPITLTPVYFVVKDITVNDVLGGYMDIDVGETKTLSLNVNAEYDVEALSSIVYNEEENITALQEAQNRIEAISTQAVWFVYDMTNGYSQIIINEQNPKISTENYEITKNTDTGYYEIKALKKIQSGTIQFGAGFVVNYDNAMTTLRAEDRTKDLDGIFSTDEEFKPKATERFVVYSYALDISESSSAENAIPVSTVEELLAMVEGRHYRLINDIDVTSAWTPLTQEVAMLDGNGFTIKLSAGFDSNLVNKQEQEEENELQTSINLGLFDTVTDNMKIYNLTVDIPYIVDQVSDDAGVTITEKNTFNNDSLSTINIGHIAGINNGTIYNCSAINSGVTTPGNTTISVNPSITLYLGGIVAQNGTNGYITNSTSSISAQISHGNLAGITAVNSGIITSSYYKAPEDIQIALSNTPTSEEGSTIAGFVAVNNGTIRTSYAEGANDNTSNKFRFNYGYVQASISTAGFVSTNNGNIENCYANIPVSGTAQTSGFVYSNAGTIDNCYSASLVQAKHDDHTPFIGTRNAGKEIQNKGTITNSYYYDNGNSFSSKLLPVSGIEKVLKIDELITSDFPTFTFNTSETVYDGIWKLDNTNHKFITLQDANDRFTEKGYFNYVGSTEVEQEGAVDEQHEWDKKDLVAFPIASAEDYNFYFNDESERLHGNTKYILDKFRLVRDIDFTKSIVPTSTNIDFSGVLQGNGMTLSGIYLVAGTNKLENYGLFNSVELIKDGTSNVIIKDVNLIVTKLTANNAIKVGSLAGSIVNSYVTNMTVDASSTVIQGVNFVGGLAGYVDNSTIRDITTSASINANYVSTTDKINTVNLYVEGDSTYTYSYVGGAVGLVNSNSTFYNIVATGTNKILGYYAGGVFGYFGKTNNASYLKMLVDVESYTLAKWISGGLVAQNLGNINKSTVEYAESDNLTFFRGSPYIVGGLVGLNEGGEYIDKETSTPKTFGYITASYSRIDISNIQANTAGGLIGVTIGGKLDSCYMLGKVEARYTVGGFVGAVADNNALSSTGTTSGHVQWFRYGNNGFNTDSKFTINNCLLYEKTENFLSVYDDPTQSVSKAKGYAVGSLKVNYKNEKGNITGLQICGSYFLTNKNKTLSDLSDYKVVGGKSDAISSANTDESYIYNGTLMTNTLSKLTNEEKATVNEDQVYVNIENQYISKYMCDLIGIEYNENYYRIQLSADGNSISYVEYTQADIEANSKYLYIHSSDMTYIPQKYIVNNGSTMAESNFVIYNKITTQDGNTKYIMQNGYLNSEEYYSASGNPGQSFSENVYVRINLEGEASQYAPIKAFANKSSIDYYALGENITINEDKESLSKEYKAIIKSFSKNYYLYDNLSVNDFYPTLIVNYN